MMNVGTVLRELHEHENDLEVQLLRMSERHKSDHEVYHVARDLSDWSRNHVARIAEVSGDYGQELPAVPRRESTAARVVRELASEAVGRRSESGELLVRDLRAIHLSAAAVSLDWEMLAQGAQLLKDRELLNLTKECHPGTLRQMRWANAMLKQVSPQVLVS